LDDSLTVDDDIPGVRRLAPGDIVLIVNRLCVPQQGKSQTVIQGKFYDGRDRLIGNTNYGQIFVLILLPDGAFYVR